MNGSNLIPTLKQVSLTLRVAYEIFLMWTHTCLHLNRRRNKWGLSERWGMQPNKTRLPLQLTYTDSQCQLMSLNTLISITDNVHLHVCRVLWRFHIQALQIRKPDIWARFQTLLHHYASLLSQQVVQTGKQMLEIKHFIVVICCTLSDLLLQYSRYVVSLCELTAKLLQSVNLPHSGFASFDELYRFSTKKFGGVHFPVAV